jgi:hypothetical protein
VARQPEESRREGGLVMRRALAILALSAGAPACAAGFEVPPPAEPQKVPAPVAVGTRVTIQVGEGEPQPAVTVADDLSLDVAGCGSVDLGETTSTPEFACAQIAKCLADIWRRPVVSIRLEASGYDPAHIGCEGPASTPPSVPTLEFNVLMGLMVEEPRHDPHVVRRLAELVIARELLLVARTPEHPDLARATDSVRALAAETKASALDPTQEPLDLAAAFGRSLAAAQARADELDPSLPPEDPERQRAQMEIDRWQRLADKAPALPTPVEAGTPPDDDDTPDEPDDDPAP